MPPTTRAWCRHALYHTIPRTNTYLLLSMLPDEWQQHAWPPVVVVVQTRMTRPDACSTCTHQGAASCQLCRLLECMAQTSSAHPHDELAFARGTDACTKRVTRRSDPLDHMAPPPRRPLQWPAKWALAVAKRLNPSAKHQLESSPCRINCACPLPPFRRTPRSQPDSMAPFVVRQLRGSRDVRASVGANVHILFRLPLSACLPLQLARFGTVLVPYELNRAPIAAPGQHFTWQRNLLGNKLYVRR